MSTQSLIITCFRSLFLICAVLLSSAAFEIQAQTSEESAESLEAELKSVAESLATVSDDNLGRRSVRTEIREKFKRAARLYVKLINHSQIDDGKEIKMAEELSEAIVSAFRPIADEFQDPLDTTHFLRAHETQTNRFLKFVYKYGGRALYAGSELFGRDLASGFVPRRDGKWMIPPGLPLVGKDAGINRLVKGVFEDLLGAFEEEIKSSGTDREKIGQARLALQGLCGRLLNVEPVQYGPIHRIVANFYLLVMVPLAFHFPIEFWPVRTEYGPDVFGFLEAAFFVWMWKVRVNNSGVNSFKIFNKMRVLAALPKLKVGEAPGCDGSLGDLGRRRYRR